MDILRFFQEVDKGLERILPRYNIPMIIAAVDFEVPIFKQATSYPQVLEESISGNPEDISPQDLHSRALEIIDPIFGREAQDRLAYPEHVAQVHARGAGKVRRNYAALFGDSLTGATVYPYCALAPFGNLTVAAHGYPSMTTSFARNKVPEIIQRENPEFMFILYGTNNNKDEKHLSEAMDDLAAVVQACEANGTVAILGTIARHDIRVPPAWGPTKRQGARLRPIE